MPVVNAERKDRARSAILDDDDRTRDRNILNAVCWPIGIMNLLCHLAGKTLTQKANPSAFDWFKSTICLVKKITICVVTFRHKDKSLMLIKQSRHKISNGF
jgi:hypothetical protein